MARESPVEWLEKSFDAVIDETRSKLKAHGMEHNGQRILIPDCDLIEHEYISRFKPIVYVNQRYGYVLFSIKGDG